MSPAAAPATAEPTPGQQKSALEITVSYGESTLDVRHLVGQKNFLIGEGKAADLTISSDDLPASEFPLVRSIDGQFVLTFIGDQRGEVEKAGAYHPLQWLKQHKDDQFPNCYRYVLGKDERATLRFGGLTLTLRYVSPPDRVERSAGQREQHYTTLLMALSIFLVLALGGGLIMTVRPELADTTDFWTNNPRVARLLGQTRASAAQHVRNVVLDSAPVAVGIDAELVRARIAAYADALSTCVAELPNGSGIRATLRIEAGKVSRVDTEALGRDQGEGGLTCVQGVLSGVDLAAPNARVVYTIGVAR